MKKHLLSIITTALVVINLVLSVVIIFSVLPTTSKMNNMITQICTALNLNLKSESDGSTTYKIEDLDEFPIEDDLTINLASSDDGEDHYVILKLTIIANNKHEDYKKYKDSITTKATLIRDAIIAEVGSVTKEEMEDNPEKVQQNVTKRLQELFNSDFIVKVAFDSFIFQ